LTVSGTGSLTTPGALVVYNTAGTALNFKGGTIYAGLFELSGNKSNFQLDGRARSISPTVAP